MKRQKPKHQKKRLFVAAGIVALVVVTAGASGVALHLRHVHEAQKRSGTVATASKAIATPAIGSKSQATAPSSSSAASTPSSSSSDKSSGAASSSVTTQATAALIAPYGTLVSNHQPGQNGSPTTEQSQCTTTPGATCNITFTNSSGIVKSLGAQIADSDGSVLWNWNVTGSDLAPGSWKVAAVATFGSQTKTTTDAESLTIQ